MSKAANQVHTAITSFGVRNLSVGYGNRMIINNLDLDLPIGGFTAILGTNGCGKSTLLRTLARVLKPHAGQVELNGHPLEKWSSKSLAQRISLLPQSPVAPDGISVRDLVARGRFPHQSLLRQWSQKDQDITESAMQTVKITDLADRRVDELSGGQRQRVWLAMSVAQDAPIMLLDEPTTYLDIAHQISVLELCATLHSQGRTIVVVLHDLNLAAQFATHLIVMKDGTVGAQGSPRDIFSADLLSDFFQVPSYILRHPDDETPIFVPKRLHN